MAEECGHGPGECEPEIGRDYLNPRPRCRVKRPPMEPPQPRPGHGTVFVNRTVDGTWDASWQDATAHQDYEGTLEEAVEWAKAQPAASRLIFDRVRQDYVPLDQVHS